MSVSIEWFYSGRIIFSPLFFNTSRIIMLRGTTRVSTTSCFFQGNKVLGPRVTSDAASVLADYFDITIERRRNQLSRFFAPWI